MKANRFALASLITAVVAALVVVLAPLGGGCSMSPPGGRERCFSTNLFQTEGSWILVVVSVPVVLALVPVVLRHRAVRAVSAVLLWVCCVIGLASVGMFFIPAAVLMTVAAAQREPVPMQA